MRTLLIDDEKNLLIVLADSLVAEGFEVFTSSDPEQALKLVSEIFPDIVVTDLKMHGLDGIELTRKIKLAIPDIPIIVLTAFGELNTAVEAIKAGAIEYLTKPVDSSNLAKILRRTIAESKHKRENLYLKNEISLRLGFKEFIGESPGAVLVKENIKKASTSSAPVIITGETGVGKELVARLIHQTSSRSKHPLLSINCRELSSSAADFFGRTSGVTSRSKLEIANGGSILLDQILTLPVDIQSQLARVIETGILEPGGGRAAVKVDIRYFVSATEDLAELKNELRPELFHRLNVLQIEIPRLSDRLDDIPLLVEFFIKNHAKANNIADVSIDPLALEALAKYDWLGNVRELSNVIERSIIMSIDRKIKLSDLPAELFQQQTNFSGDFLGLREKLLSEEKRLIIKSLEENSYIQHRAAKTLGISRSLLNQKIKRLQIPIVK